MERCRALTRGLDSLGGYIRSRRPRRSLTRSTATAVRVMEGFSISDRKRLMEPRVDSLAKDVLLVEDNPADALLVRRCFERRTPQHRIHVAKDASEARAFLHQEHPFRRAPRPSLVLLDLNLPKVGGHELLAQIKHDSCFHTIAIVVLSSSDAGSDITRSYELGANAYLVKPISIQKLRTLIGCIDTLWLH